MRATLLWRGLLILVVSQVLACDGSRQGATPIGSPWIATSDTPRFVRVESEFVPIDSDDRQAVPGPFRILDLNGDGQLEVVFVLMSYPRCEPQPVQVLQLVGEVVQPDARFWHGSAPRVRHSTQIHHLDFNQDGHMDLVVSDAGLDYHPWSGSRLALCYGHEAGFMDRSDLLPREVWTARSYALAAGVLNPDDGPVMLLPRQSSDAAHGIVRHSDGRLIFEPEWIDEPRKYLSFSECAALEDFDRDGHTDLYLGGNWSTPGHTLFWGTGQSTLHDSTTADLPPAPFGHTTWDDFQQSSDSYVEGGSVAPVAIVDVDSDGWPDIVTISERVHCYTSGKAPRKKNVWTNGPNAYLDEQVQILRNNTDRSFTDISGRTAGRNLGHVYVRCLVAADINRDGHADLIAPFTDKETYEFGTLFLINDGTGRFDVVDAKAILGKACHVNQGNGRTEAGAVMPIKIGKSGITAALISPVSGRRGRFGYQLSTVQSQGFLSTGPGLSDPAARGVAGFNESYYLDRYADARSAVRAGQYPDGLDFYLAVGQHRGDFICAPSTTVWASSDGDTFRFNVDSTDVAITIPQEGSWVIADQEGGYGTLTLHGIRYLQFRDRTVN